MIMFKFHTYLGPLAYIQNTFQNGIFIEFYLISLQLKARKIKPASIINKFCERVITNM